ncbi:alpha/beta fold hydrolase [Microlunatus antarcticus]|uniref:Pimeloyl-ACP methyl ester carboxylesterase n=1 Tax=Microlunatus antarcticus TaxID=53388 RepID=A0A7W5JZD1_9ACTN|nr:alpha/beta hydrolase [Microlunatus antarcticus]MBB3329099.1 pimeloyl-ACP methyl ester carboxylesterase [Microlunatus antarcticus]
MSDLTTSDLTIDSFDHQRIRGADGVELSVAVGGSGPPVVLLHGFPQTHLMWRHVARELAADFTVVCPDLRGYGASDKPAATGPDVYAKRTMAADVVAVAAALGHARFALVGHDRGALVAVRAGLDHPDVVTHLGVLDVLPTLDMWDVLHGVQAAVAWHLYLMAQPPGLPEAMIEATADRFFASFLDAWGTDDATIPADVRRHYLAASAAAVPSIVADYRASAGIDLDHDRADRAAGRQLTMPVGVLSQDWGGQLGFDAAALWGAWAPNLTFQPIQAGHFMAEQAPGEVAAYVRGLVAR